MAWHRPRDKFVWSHDARLYVARLQDVNLRLFLRVFLGSSYIFEVEINLKWNKISYIYNTYIIYASVRSYVKVILLSKDQF